MQTCMILLFNKNKYGLNIFKFLDRIYINDKKEKIKSVVNFELIKVKAYSIKVIQSDLYKIRV